jgi:RNA polymerase sigma factor (sigma-70 family)
MATSKTLLSRAIRSAIAIGIASENDRDLLRRFADTGDQQAFAHLFRRHFGLVFGVCHRALSNAQDAEDACQATFLILARKARSADWQQSLANWLYTTARRVSRNVLVTAQRRLRREKRAAVPESVQAVDQMTGRELLAVLDEELDRLPPRFREPLVLCYLQGLTRDEAANRLGVPLSTLKSHLERGRKRLGEALTRRGCAPGAGLFAVALSPPSHAVPPGLLQAVLASLSGSPSVAVASVVRQVVVDRAVNRSVVALLLLAGVAALGFGLVSVNLSAAARTPPQAASAQAPAPDQPPGKEPAKVAAHSGITVTGRAFRPDGEPLAAAKLILVAAEMPPTQLGTTDAAGRFTVSLPKNTLSRRLVVQSDAFGTDFVELDRFVPGTEIVLRTVRDNAIRGRLVDTQGKPVAGATVTGSSLAIYPGESLDSFLTEWKTRPYYAPMPPGVKNLWNGMASYLSAKTDSDGRFALHGAGAERVALLRVSGPGIADFQVMVVNRAGFDPGPYNETTRKKQPPGGAALGYNPALYGPDLSLVAEAEKVIEGTITDEETGSPRVGISVQVQSVLQRSTSRRWSPNLRAPARSRVR